MRNAVSALLAEGKTPSEIARLLPEQRFRQVCKFRKQLLAGLNGEPNYKGNQKYSKNRGAIVEAIGEEMLKDAETSVSKMKAKLATRGLVVSWSTTRLMMRQRHKPLKKLDGRALTTKS